MSSNLFNDRLETDFLSYLIAEIRSRNPKRGKVAFDTLRQQYEIRLAKNSKKRLQVYLKDKKECIDTAKSLACEVLLRDFAWRADELVSVNFSYLAIAVDFRTVDFLRQTGYSKRITKQVLIQKIEPGPLTTIHAHDHGLNGKRSFKICRCKSNPQLNRPYGSKDEQTTYEFVDKDTIRVHVPLGDRPKDSCSTQKVVEQLGYLSIPAYAKPLLNLQDLGGKSPEGEQQALDPPSQEPMPEIVAADRDERRLIEKFLHMISSEQADVIRQHLLEGKTFVEIEESTGIPANTLGARFKAGMKKIRKLVAETDPREREP